MPKSVIIKTLVLFFLLLSLLKTYPFWFDSNKEQKPISILNQPQPGSDRLILFARQYIGLR